MGAGHLSMFYNQTIDNSINVGTGKNYQLSGWFHTKP